MLHNKKTNASDRSWSKLRNKYHLYLYAGYRGLNCDSDILKTLKEVIAVPKSNSPLHKILWWARNNEYKCQNRWTHAFFAFLKENNLLIIHSRPPLKVSLKRKSRLFFDVTITEDSIITWNCQIKLKHSLAIFNRKSMFFDKRRKNGGHYE